MMWCFFRRGLVALRPLSRWPDLAAHLRPNRVAPPTRGIGCGARAGWKQAGIATAVRAPRRAVAAPMLDGAALGTRRSGRPRRSLIHPLSSSVVDRRSRRAVSWSAAQASSPTWMDRRTSPCLVGRLFISRSITQGLPARLRSCVTLLKTRSCVSARVRVYLTRKELMVTPRQEPRFSGAGRQSKQP